MTVYKIIVEGTVQGVSFRAYVRHVGNMMKIKGYVENRPDGTVLIVAEFNRKLSEFVDNMFNAPQPIKVDKLIIQPVPSENEDVNKLSGFVIKY